MKLNQFAVYRVDQQTAGKALWHLPYQEARQQNVSITVENYRLVSIHEMQENEKVADIWKRTKNQCEVSDVLVLNKNGEISCYYVDENYPQYLAGFIRINTSGALITMETENYQIDGKKGNWIATDTIIIDGKQFYLKEHHVHRDQEHTAHRQDAAEEEDEVHHRFQPLSRGSGERNLFVVHSIIAFRNYSFTGTAPAVRIRSAASALVAKSKKACACSDRVTDLLVTNTKGRCTS